LNPDGYVAHLDRTVGISTIARSYVTEALNAYGADCFRAAAVLIGCASERTVLEVRDTLLQRLKELGRTPQSKLTDCRLATVLDGLSGTLAPSRGNMPRELREEYDAHWASFTGQIRLTRNEAGHPSSIEPISQGRVHASLLIFPDLAALAQRLQEWISTDFV
jgi:hypothetical protein